jgi:hypothetical protein
MERGGKDSKGQREVEGSLGSPLHQKVEEDGISKIKLDSGTSNEIKITSFHNLSSTLVTKPPII